jgi:hypothetical protein
MTDSEFLCEMFNRYSRLYRREHQFFNEPSRLLCYIERDGDARVLLGFDDCTKETADDFCQGFHDAALAVGIKIAVFKYYLNQNKFTPNQELVEQFQKETT